MRGASAGLNNALANNPSTLCRLWRITRTDGTVYRFTDHDQDVAIPSDGTYVSSQSFTCSAILTCASQANAQTVTVTFNTDPGNISEAALRLRLFDNALAEFMYCDYTQPSNGVMNMYRGLFAQVKLYDKQRCDVEVIPIVTAAVPNIGSELYSVTCRNQYGDANCTHALTTQSFTVGSISNTPAVSTDQLIGNGQTLDFTPGDTVTIGAKTYTFYAVVTGVTNTWPPQASLLALPSADGSVALGGSIAASLVNLAAAINLSTGGFTVKLYPFGIYGFGAAYYYSASAGAGLIYGSSETVDPLVTASASGSRLTVSAKSIGPTITVSTSSVSAAWASPSLVGGFAGPTIVDATHLTQANNFWANGFVKWSTGANAGATTPVAASSQSATSISLTVPTLLPIQVGDTGVVTDGCDKQIGTCLSVKANVANFNGEPALELLSGTVAGFTQSNIQPPAPRGVNTF